MKNCTSTIIRKSGTRYKLTIYKRGISVKSHLNGVQKIGGAFDEVLLHSSKNVLAQFAKTQKSFKLKILLALYAKMRDLRVRELWISVFM